MNLLSLKNLVSLEAVNDVSYTAHSKTDSYSYSKNFSATYFYLKAKDRTSKSYRRHWNSY